MHLIAPTLEKTINADANGIFCIYFSLLVGAWESIINRFTNSGVDIFFGSDLYI